MAEPILDQIRDVGAGPARNTVAIRVWAAQNQRPQRGLLSLCQARGTNAGPITQAADALCVVANHGVAQRLPFHSGETGRLGA